ncbi:MAG: type II toxin-antitoxin system ParD family antitoxin [Hyphomonadaceae bacterium]|nr:type II toxin-antitoxin system ParD family antitoxin [Hyphomonadaceae bacterium]
MPAGILRVMGKVTAFTLDAHLADFVAAQVAEGRYATASDVVQEGLRLLQERERKIDDLRIALLEGEASGSQRDFDFDDFIARRRGDPSA